MRKFAVYTIVDSPKPNSKKNWVKLGNAVKNRDGSINVILDACPTNGTLHIRDIAQTLPDGFVKKDGTA